MFPERTWVMVDGIYRYNFMEKIYTGIYNNRFEHLLPVQTVPVLGQVKKLSLSRGKRLYGIEQRCDNESTRVSDTASCTLLNLV